MKAERHFLIALDINPKYVICMMEMALLQLVMKNKNKAVNFYQRAKKILPNISDATLDKVLEDKSVKN